MSALRTRRYRALRKALEDESAVSAAASDSEITDDNDEDAMIIDPPIMEHSSFSDASSYTVTFPKDNSLNSESVAEIDSVQISGSDSETASKNSSRSGAALMECGLENETPSLTVKLREWTIRNVAHVTNSCVTELLNILRGEGYTELPKTAETLLGTARRGKDYAIRSMTGNKKAAGEYVYIGIQKQLEKIILPDKFKESIIRILVNVDGTPLYNDSSITLWPILIHVIAPGYHSDPIMVGAFCGVTKPKRADDFLQDFVEEASVLMNTGITIKEKHYNFEIVAFVCDTPARSFLKCTKGHTGFFSCERCEVKGETRETNTRVFPEIDCPLRTSESFRAKSQQEHHHKNKTSPLIDIPGFDPVNQVTLDYMHLLCVGAMKTLLKTWINGNKQDPTTLAPGSREDLQNVLDHAVTPSVTEEFQRKTYDLSDLPHWKATQTRFFLLYAGGLIMKAFLPKKIYRHFLLLVAACRILCDYEIAVERAEEAKAYLREFFVAMPKYYGNCCQTINMHNLIHVADDVRNLKMPLSSFSSFPFENYLGKLKKLVRTPHAPLAQIVRRLSEVGSVENNGIQTIPAFSNYSCKETNDSTTITRIRVKNIFISTAEPDNIVTTDNNKIVRVEKINVPENWNNAEMPSACKGLSFRGRAIETLQEDVFKKPCSAMDIGIKSLGRISRREKEYPLSIITKKVIKLDIGDSSYAVALLHRQ